MTRVRGARASAVCVAVVSLIAAAASTAAPFSGRGSGGTPTYAGHSQGVNLVLSVVARKPDVTAWELSFKFTRAAAPLLRKVERILGPVKQPFGQAGQLSAFCLPRIAKGGWQAFFGPSDLRKGSLRVAHAWRPALRVLDHAWGSPLAQHQVRAETTSELQDLSLGELPALRARLLSRASGASAAHGGRVGLPSSLLEWVGLLRTRLTGRDRQEPQAWVWCPSWGRLRVSAGR